MGTAVAPNAFPQLNQFLNAPALLGFKSAGKMPDEKAALPALFSGGKSPAADQGPQPEAVAGDFEAATYSAQMQRVSLVAELQQVRERIAASQEDGEGQAAQAAVDQLQFSFFAESRYEELAVFQQRAAEVAEGLEGAQQQSFVQTSRQVSMRFSLSVSFTGASLNGFAGAAEGLQNDGEAFDEFLSFAQDALGQLDEVADEIFSLMQDLVQGGGDLQERLTTFFNELQSMGLFQEGGIPAFPAGESNGAGGQVQAQQFSMQMEFEFEYAEVSVEQGQVKESDPIVLDLDGDGIELTSYRNGARFDITGTGREVNTAFVTGGDAFLAVDRNGNGRIDDGTELFGDQNGAANGFEELRKLDSNADGRINRLDEGFDALRLFRDDGDGKTEDGELIGLADAGVEEILLGYRNVNQVAAGGNRIEQTASFIRNDGTRGAAADAILNFTV